MNFFFSKILFSGYIFHDSTKYTLNMADFSAIFYIAGIVEAVAKMVSGFYPPI
jgi:hypothetical protein